MPQETDTSRATPPQPRQQQRPPGHTDEMAPQPDHGEHSYKGCGRLAGKAALITGADSGIGRAVAIAFAREGADVLISYLSEHEDAKETHRWVEQAGQRGICVPGDIAEEAHCRALVERVVREFGRLDILVNNAALQRTHESIAEISSAEWDADVPHQRLCHVLAVPGGDPAHAAGCCDREHQFDQREEPEPESAGPMRRRRARSRTSPPGWRELVAERGIRVNAVAPGPIWTPLIPSTMPPDHVESFGKNTPLGRAGQPAELAAAYVLLASDEASYITGALLPVTGGRPML